MPPFMEQGMPTEQITIAEVLRDAGYYTAHIGKWHLGHEYGMDPMSQGFQDSLGLVGPLYLPEDHPDVVNAKFDTRIDKMIWGMGQYSANFNGGDLFAPDKYVTDYYTDEALKVIENNKKIMMFDSVTSQKNIVKVSIVGVGMRSHAGIAGRMFKCLAKNKVNIRMISTSEIKISVVIEQKSLEIAVQALHNEFKLDKK